MVILRVHRFIKHLIFTAFLSVWNSMDIYLQRCRDDDEKVGRIRSNTGFDCNVYVVCNNEVVDSDSGSLTEFSCFNIGKAYQRSKGFACLEHSCEDVDSLRIEYFHIFYTASTPNSVLFAIDYCQRQNSSTLCSKDGIYKE